MNKKQLIITWIMGFLIIGTIWGGDYSNRVAYMRGDSLIIEFFSSLITLVIVGILLIYTVRDKK